MAVRLPRLRTASLRAGTAWYRVYNATWGYDEHNPGYGDARFSPIDDPAGGGRLPSMYLAATPAAALLETVFHDVHHGSGRIIYERNLRGMLLAHVRAPAVARLADLRDPELARLGLHREQVVSSDAEHYPCTRRLAVAALGAGTRRAERPRSDLAFAAGRAGRPGPGRGDGALWGAAVLLAARQLAAFRPRRLVVVRWSRPAARR